MTERKQTAGEIIRLIPIALYIFVFITIVNALTNQKHFPKDLVEMTIDREITLSTDPAKKEGTRVIHKGETVSYLGFRKGTVTVNMVRLYVQTQDGVRGYFNAYELGYPVIHAKTRDTVTIINPKTSDTWPKALVRFPDGTEKEIDYDDLGVILPKNLRKTAFSDAAACYMTEKKFKKLYVGKKLEECDQLNHPALVINREDDQTFQAYYPTLYIFNAKEGRFYRPVLHTDNSSVVTDYDLIQPFGNNKWILKLLPFVSPIMDNNFFSTLIRSSFFDNSTMFFDLAAAKYNWTRWPIALFYFLFGGIWALGFAGFIMVILRTLLIWRYSFYLFNNASLRLIFVVPAVIAAYIWFVLILIWGLIWPIAILVFPASLFFYRYSIKELDDYVPHLRCLKCCRLYTMDLTDDVFLKEYDEWRPLSEHGRLLSSGTKHIKTTYTETTYSDGSKKTSNYRDHYREYKTYEIIHYSVLYHVKEYEKVYTCNCCGNIEKSPYEKLQELERKHVGTSTTTDTYDYVR